MGGSCTDRWPSRLSAFALLQLLLLPFCSLQPLRHGSQFFLEFLVLLCELHDVACAFLNSLHPGKVASIMRSEARSIEHGSHGLKKHCMHRRKGKRASTYSGSAAAIVIDSERMDSKVVVRSRSECGRSRSGRIGSGMGAMGMSMDAASSEYSCWTSKLFLLWMCLELVRARCRKASDSG